MTALGPKYFDKKSEMLIATVFCTGAATAEAMMGSSDWNAELRELWSIGARLLAFTDATSPRQNNNIFHLTQLRLSE